MQRSRFVSLLTLPVLCSTLAGCGSRRQLLLLNWGEYINDEVVANFEKEYNCEVVVSIADSNELFYSKVKSGTTVYDLVVPSDYMVKKMKEANLIQKIDTSRLSNYDENNFLPGVLGIETEFINNYGFEDIKEYLIPYFWGTFGLMYNNNKVGLKEALEKDGWDAYFDKSKLPSGTRTGMYNVPRNSYAACLFKENFSPNLEGDEYLKIVEKDLSNAHFDQWGTDDLKKQVQKGDLDVAYMYTGDFLDMFYQDIEDGVKKEDITYDVYIPKNTIAFMDNFVLTKNARHVDLAYDFMNYFLDTDNAYENASVVGYCTPLKSTYEKILSDGDARSYAMEKYYPIIDDETKPYIGTPLTNFDKNYLTKITNIVNDVKTRR
ncbi:MAG: extracellular solute-binding protein [Bacilli bacterium]|nr:extracellular solute-binding protein [Bacilli bacterium]